MGHDRLDETIKNYLILGEQIANFRKKHNLKIYYSFIESSYGLDKKLSKSFKPFTIEQKKALYELFEIFSSLIPCQFIERDDYESSGDDNNLRFYNSRYYGPDEFSAITIFRAYDKKHREFEMSSASNDQEIELLKTHIFVDHKTKEFNINKKFKINDNLFSTMIHELMHFWGVGHGHDIGLSKKETISSYRSHPSYSHKGPSITGNQNPTTPLLYDIAYLHSRFGQNMETRKNDTYYQFTQNEVSHIQCLWDAGGNDDLDISRSEGFSVLDLNDGCYSSIGVNDDGIIIHSNFSLAFTCNVENATGTDEGTIFLSNEKDNIINGGNGDNVLYLRDFHLQTSYTPNDKQKIHQTIQKRGWGNDIYYSSNGINRIFIDVKNTRRLVFMKSNDHLIIDHLVYDENNEQAVRSTLTIAQFNPQKTIFYFRDRRDSRQTFNLTRYKEKLTKGKKIEDRFEQKYSTDNLTTMLNIKIRHYEDDLADINNNFDTRAPRWVPFAF